MNEPLRSESRARTPPSSVEGRSSGEDSQSANTPLVGQHVDATVPNALPLRDLTDDDLHSVPERWVLLPACLFLATCVSTFLVGALNWNLTGVLQFFQGHPGAVLRGVASNWTDGVKYMGAVIAILLMHEMGHFLQTVRYGVPASFPFFLPVPFMMTGTMGAVISMDGARADRKQLFDIGLTGPWAGLITALPIIYLGIKHGVPMQPQFGEGHLGYPLIFKLLTSYLRPELPAGADLQKNPWLMAGWVGMLITGLNMLPVSQLDGGHVIYSLFGRHAHWIARGFVVACIIAMLVSDYYNWILMLVLVLALGVDHPPTRDDQVPLGWARYLIGIVSLLIPVFCFTPKII